MSRSSVLLVLIAGLFAATIAGAATFADENPIRQVVVSEEVESGILQVVGESDDALSFARFVNKYGKKYDSVEEMKLRFEIFVENLKMIRSHNNKRSFVSYKLGVNKFTDLTWDEFRRVKLQGTPQNCSATTKSNLKFTNGLLPEKKDWRETGIVSPVKAQGDCGACWTFSTTGALEAAYAQAFGKGISLSEQQLVDCAGAFDNHGCNGGLPSHAFEYIKYNGGLETEESYPYTAKDGICKFKPQNVAVKVIDSVNITEGAEDELKIAVAFIRPVSVAFEVIDGFKQYESGVYTSTACGNTSMDVNHAVLAVGYGVENGVPYWLIKTHGEQIGVTMDTSKWRWEKTCVGLQLVHPIQSWPNYMNTCISNRLSRILQKYTPNRLTFLKSLSNIHITKIKQSTLSSISMYPYY